jgi:recombination protein RecA
MAAPAVALEALIERFGRFDRDHDREKALALAWPELDALLPDGGLPRGVVELCAPHALGGATRIAMRAVRAAHRRDARAWCAWIDPEATLFAPALEAAGVDLARMLVVRPPREELGRVAVEVTGSGAFDVVVIDVDPVPFAAAPSRARAPEKKQKRYSGDLLVRKLSLAAEKAGAVVVLVADASAPRPAPWPVALRIELAREDPKELTLRVAKDKRGRIGVKKTIPWRLAQVG